MILKDIIEELEKHPQETVVRQGFGRANSYRGDYNSIGFAPETYVSIGYMLHEARYAIGKTYQGWKGGEYTMDEYTDCYIAANGESGESIGKMLLGYILADVA